jgi:hypothetical protein
MPGVSVSEGFDPKNKGLFGTVDISFSGSPAVDNQWRVDGAPNNDIGSQHTILIYPSIDGIEEFKIQRNSYGPEYGGAGGAQINIVTKGGGNQFHGDAFYFGRNAFLNASNFFVGHGADCNGADKGSAACQKQGLRRNDYGYTFGGPIKKDKLFFFWNEEWNTERRGFVRHHWVPTAAERTGDFSDLAAAWIASGANNAQLSNGTCKAPPVPLDPTTGLPFPGFKIPANRLSPAGAAMIAPFAFPTISNLCASQNWVAQVNVPTNWRQENIRGDYNLTKSTTLMLKFTQDSWVNPLHAGNALQTGLWGDSDYPALSDSWNQPGKMAIAKLTTTLGSTAVNDFQFSWSANRINISRAGDNPALGDAITATFPRLFPLNGKLNGTNQNWPVTWGTGEPAGSTLGTIGPYFNRQDLYTWKDDFSKVMGNHTFKFGGLYSRNAKDQETGQEAGQFWGTGDNGGTAIDYKGPGWTSPNFCGGGWAAGCNIGTGNVYGDYLLKGMTYGYGENQTNAVDPVRWRDYEFYGGDTWKATRRLTLTYGFRWSLIRNPYIDNNLFAGFLPSAFNPANGTDPCNGIVVARGAPSGACAAIGSKLTAPQASNRSLVPDNNHFVSPRLGFAWDVFGNQRFVFRGGLGQFISRDRLVQTDMTGNPPFGVSTGGEITLDGANRTMFKGSDAGNEAACVTTGCAFGIALGGTPGTGIDPNPNQANSWQWNLTTETAFGRNSKLELAWVGNRGIHLNDAWDANQVPAKFRLQAAQAAVSGGSINAFRPLTALTNNSMIIWAHLGDSTYHSLQSMFTTKLHRDSMLQLSYTWSKNLGDSSFGYNNNTNVFADNSNSRANRGPVDFDRRHVLSANFIYNLPYLDRENSLLKQTFGHWETSTIVNYASGNAITIQGSSGLGDVVGAGSNGLFVNRPLRVAGQPCHVSGADSSQWLNPAAFTWSGYQLGTLGNSGPGQCAGPPVNDTDFSLMKNWGVPFLKGSRFFGETARVQFRMEFFKLFNHPQFRFGGANLAYNVSGAIPVNASGTDCRSNFGGGGAATCVAVKGGVLDPTLHFGQPQTTSNIGSREIQYALKFIF